MITYCYNHILRLRVPYWYEKRFLQTETKQTETEPLQLFSPTLRGA